MDNEYTQRIKKIEAELEHWLPSDRNSDWKNNIFSGIEKEKNAVCSSASFDALFTPLKDMLSRGGKRWRPLLMTLVCETLGGADAALPLAPLVEFSHNASLIHDDIEDNSGQRRGRPAIHTIYGTDTAINSGSFLYFLSLCCIESYKGENKEQIYRIWSEYMRRLHLGQAIDISWHRDINFIPDMDEYYYMCTLKTGSLARLATELGVYAAGGSQEAAQVSGEVTEKLGIGFQILDDIRNLTTGILGKKRGDDIVEGKKSLPVILYLKKHPKQKEKISRCFYEAKIKGIAVPEVNEVIKLITEAGILKEAEEKALSLINDARVFFKSEQYAGIPAKKEGRDLLNGFIDLIS